MAGLGAATFRSLIEVVSGSDKRRLAVVLASQLELGTDPMSSSLADGLPNFAVPPQHIKVADDEHAMLGSRQQHAHAIGGPQEAHGILFVHWSMEILPAVASHHGNQHQLVLFALILIHHTNHQVLETRVTAKQLVAKAVNGSLLAQVGRQDRDVRRTIALIDQVLGQAHNKLSLEPVASRAGIFLMLLEVVVVDEIDVLRSSQHPRVVQHAGRVVDEVVIVHGGQGRDLRPHATLSLQNLELQPSVHEAFKKRNIETVLHGEIVMGGGRLQLLVIANQN